MPQIPLNENLPKMYKHSKRKSGYVMGPKIYTFESNESSGADIQIIGRRNKQCQAKIMGTAEQIKMVVKLLQDTLGRTNYFSPSIGFTSLDVSDEYESRYIGSDIKIISFYKASNDNHETSPFDKYIFAINALPTWIQMLKPCLKQISNFCEALIYEKKISTDEEFRLKVCFGVTTSFSHDVGSPERDYIIGRLIQDFGFRQVNLVEETFVSENYLEDKKADEKYLSARNNRHRFGKGSPNLRLLIKSQKPSRFPISKKYHRIIDNIQRSNRFLGKVILPQMESSNVRVLDNQSSKSIYVKVEAIRLNFMSTLQDEGDRVTSEDTVNLIHHYRNIRFQFLEIV
ncbi:1824_t:CDS:2 [Funneliformis mosseae]|uniref:1824_t:CDS:1 n=1 Tax=Funneliformis mosseae TaxID=27381 RepID=A0A9N8ZEG8_FUNMO|nr:1824_t:CDS:2 [Funneliformis mosseae]